jgi:hypothetical protein
VTAIRDIRVGKGWSPTGIGIVIAPFVPGLDDLAAGHAVSFEAPDPVTGRYVTYALHAYTTQEANELARQLRGR